MFAVAWRATTLVALPPLMGPVLTVVPLAGSAMAAAATTNSQSAVIAHDPSWYASPACDAIPVGWLPRGPAGSERLRVPLLTVTGPAPGAWGPGDRDPRPTGPESGET